MGRLFQFSLLVEAVPCAWTSYMASLCQQYACIFFSSCSASSSNMEKGMFTWSNICPFPEQIFFMCKSIKHSLFHLYCTHTHTHTHTHTRAVSFRQGLGESCLSKTESLRPIQHSRVQCNAQAFSSSISLN